MNNFKVIEAEDQAWSDVINRAKLYDFHHTSCFHQLEQQEGERSILCVGEYGDELIALPLIVRKIPNSDFLDATSVYGYCGPIASSHFKNLKVKCVSKFREDLLNFFKKSRIISVFSRLHPLIDTAYFFDGFGIKKDLNKTICLDLTLDIDEQRRGYRKSNKSEINQLRGKKGYTVVEATSEDQIREFVEIYTQTMKRVDASDGYFFDLEYFKALLFNPCFEGKLLLAIKDGKVAAGAVFTITNTIMQYHLAGTRDEFISDTPMKLILDEARLLGSKLGLESLHLGGGVGGSDEDSLFKFKSGFSKNFCQFSVWKFVTDQIAYDDLILQKGIDVNKAGDFFPTYRATS